MPTPIVSILDEPDYAAQIARGANALISGGVVVLPTETVYGAAGLLKDVGATARLRALRGGEGNKPFTIHVARSEDALQYLGPVSELGQRLMKKLWPGPVGLRFDVPAERRAEVAARLNLAETDLYDSGGITLRCPDHRVTTDILAQVPGPVVLTMAGANAGGPNLKIESLARELEGKVDLIFDTGPTKYSKPSTLLKVRPDSYQIVRVGVYDARIIERLLKTIFVFICSGNTCRSPMAEGLARHLLAKKLQVPESQLEKKGISILSAGSSAMAGMRAAPQAVEVLKEMGVDLTRHRSRPLSVELIHQADVIYTMCQAHAQAVRALVPSAADKVRMLNPDRDIEDPIGANVGVYKQVAEQLTMLIEKQLDEGTMP
jgi:protein-tyrosine phosphatase